MINIISISFKILKKTTITKQISRKYTKQTKREEVTDNVMQFKGRYIDVHHVKLIGGDGGNGSFSMSKLPNKSIYAGGRFDGGNGGTGGGFRIQLRPKKRDLTAIHNIYKGFSGGSGRKASISGKLARNTKIFVPNNTLIFRYDKSKEIQDDLGKISNRFDCKGELISEINTLNRFHEFPLGGEGGNGSLALYTRLSKKNAKQFNELVKNRIKEPNPQPCKGQLGNQIDIIMEMRYISDQGLIGFPNAGKSTLLGSLTKSVPKIASYEFTTLIPQVGYMEFDDGNVVTLSDFPGIIEDASKGRGLGIQFLKHMLKARMLIQVLDCQDIQILYKLDILMKEVQAFSDEFKKKKFLILLNKRDDNVELYENNAKYVYKEMNNLINKQSVSEMQEDIIEISAKNDQNLNVVVKKLQDIQKLSKIDEEIEEELN